MDAVEGQSGDPAPLASENSSYRVLKETWTRIATAQQNILSERNFADLADQARDNSELMYYI